MPATAVAVLEILQHHQVPITGRRVVVVGRSKVVGQPTAALLANHGAEVTVAHSETEDVVAETQQAEILVVAVGKPGLIGPEHVQRPDGGRGLRHQRHPGRGGRRRGLRRRAAHGGGHHPGPRRRRTGDHDHAPGPGGHRRRAPGGISLPRLTDTDGGPRHRAASPAVLLSRPPSRRASVAAVAGFGGAAIAPAVLVALFGPRDAIPILAVAGLVSNGSRVALNRDAISWPIVGWFALGGIPAALIGGFLFAAAPLEALTRLIGAFLWPRWPGATSAAADRRPRSSDLHPHRCGLRLCLGPGRIHRADHGPSSSPPGW